MFESDSGILTSHSGYGSSDYSSRMSEEWVIRYQQPPVELSTIVSIFEFSLAALQLHRMTE